MPSEASSHWYLRDKKGVHGPFTEPEMRRFVRNSEDQDLQIRQGSSDWHSADAVRAKIRELARDGIYIRFKGTTEGPFTVRRAYEVLVPLGSDGIIVRTGAKGNWVSAAAWLNKVDEMRERHSVPPDASRGAQASMANAQRPVSAPSDEKASDASSSHSSTNTHVDRNQKRGELESSEHIPVAEAVVETDDIPVVEAVPIPIEAADGQQLVQRKARTRPAVPTVPSVNHSVDTLSNSGHTRPDVPSLQLGRRQAPVRPLNRTLTASRMPWLKVVASIVSVICVLAIIGFISAEPLGDLLSNGNKEESLANLEPAMPDRDAGEQSLVSASGLSVEGNNDVEASRPAPSVSPSPTDNATAAARSNAFGGSSTSDTMPVHVEAGTLFRPRFGTIDGEVDAGTAFAATMINRDDTLLISALHLFGPAGGLDRDIPAAELATHWNGLVLEDCKSQSFFGDVPMKVLSIPDAKPLPESSLHGDVVVCLAESGAGLSPLVLSRNTPTRGQKVWLVSKVLGSRSLLHAATVEGIQDGWLVYTYDSPRIELRATSGAPVVDQNGQVVAVNAGGGEDGGKTMGVGTPVSKFYTIIESQL